MNKGAADYVELNSRRMQNMTASVSYPFNEFTSQLLADALAAAKTVKDARTEAAILSRIAIYYTRFEQQNLAVEVLSSAVNAAKKIKEAGSKVKAICEVAAICQFEPGLKEEISEILTQALQVAQTIVNSEEQNQVLAEIAFRYANAGQEHEAMQVFELIEDASQKKAAKNSFCHRVIREFTDTGQHDKAIETVLVSEIINYSEKLTTLFWMAVDYADLDQIKLAERALSEALQIAVMLNNSLDKVSELISIAGVYCTIGDRDTAVEILSQAYVIFISIGAGDTENTRYILALIAIAFAQAGKPETALQLAQSIPDSQDTFYLKVDVLKEIVGAYAQAGQIDRANAQLSQAFEIANGIQNADEKANSFILLSEKYIVIGHIDRAAELLGQALNIVKHLNSDKQANQLNSIVFFYKKAKLYDKALEVAKEIKEKKLRNTAVADLALNYAEAGDYSQALQIIEALDDAKYKGEALAKIALKLAEIGEKDQSFKTFKQAIEVVKAIKNPGNKHDELGIIIRWYMKTREYDRMQEIVKNLQDDSIEFQVLTWIANGYKQTGKPSKAAEISSLADRAIERMKDTSEKAQLMAGISYRYAVVGEYDRAVQLVRDIKNAMAKALALLDIVELYAVANSD